MLKFFAPPSARSCIDTIRDAAIDVCGGFRVDVDLEGAVEHDKVLLSLTKADGTHPTIDESDKLIKDAKVRAKVAATEPIRMLCPQALPVKFVSVCAMAPTPRFCYP